MTKQKLIEDIKRACELHGGESLLEKFSDGTISDESLRKAYEKIIGKNFSESADSIATVSDFCSECAILCYEIAVKNGEV